MSSEYIIDVEAGEELDPIGLLPQTFIWGVGLGYESGYPVVPILEYKGFKIGDRISYSTRDAYTITCFVDISNNVDWVKDMGSIAAGLDNSGIANLNLFEIITS